MVKEDYKRTLANKLISRLNSARYFIIEQVILKLLRLKYERNYKDRQEKPLISVYAPTYNRAEILMERAIPSVLSQTYTNFEFIIVGDCCTDKTSELVKKIKDPRIRFYNLHKRGYRYPPTAENHWLAGPVTASNKGLEMVRGKWIARIDDDDTWTEDHLESLLNFAQEGDYEFVSAQYLEEKHGQRRIDTGVGARDAYYTKSDGPITGSNPLIGGTQTWLYRSYLRFMRYNLNCWRKEWNRVNDVDLSQRIFKAGARMGFLNKLVAFVLPRPGELTVGVEAYKLQAKEKEQLYKFND